MLVSSPNEKTATKLTSAVNCWRNYSRHPNKASPLRRSCSFKGSDTRVRQPAVDVQRLPAHVGAAAWTAEGADHAGDLEGRAPAAGRNIPPRRLLSRRARSFDLPKRYAIHACSKFERVFTATLAPPEASNSAIARPILRAAPVTSATLPANSSPLCMPVRSWQSSPSVKCLIVPSNVRPSVTGTRFGMGWRAQCGPVLSKLSWRRHTPGA